MDIGEETRDYWSSVDGIVSEIVQEVRAGDCEPDEWSDRLYEMADGNQHVIYTYQAKLVVAFISDNDTAAFDEGMELDHSAGINWSGLAYFAMAADVRDRMPDLDEMMEERNEILESIARALFVTAFADACEDSDVTDSEIDRSQMARGGDDWFDTVTDDTPGEAMEKAKEIVEDFEKRNGRGIEEAGNEWAMLEFHYGGRRTQDLETFGHYVAMTYLGHGVGLWDDFKGEPPKGFECGHDEFHASEWI